MVGVREAEVSDNFQPYFFFDYPGEGRAAIGLYTPENKRYPPEERLFFVRKGHFSERNLRRFSYGRSYLAGHLLGSDGLREGSR